MSSQTTGYIDFTFGGERFQTWYTTAGDLTFGRRPLVLLHGGPGIPHSYMLPHIDLATSHGIPIILYDQIGCGNSTRLRDKPKAFFTVAFFMAELENVLAHFGVAHDFDLLGHSWGGMLASDWVSTRHPPGLRHLILADSLASMELWEVSVNKLLSRFPEEFREMLHKHEREGTTDSKEYQDGMAVFYQKHICTLDPWPEDLVKAFAGMEEDPTVYSTMLGTSEFNINGTLKTWTVLDKIHTIACPTLVINGADDEAQDECVGPFFEKINTAKWVQFAKSSHMPFFEERERYFQVVADFLKA
ncbi:proline-specific peptidase [Amylostereum chailletii]|nr:proline-specific peptidase [Amylostereum chailletii]